MLGFILTYCIPVSLPFSTFCEFLSVLLSFTLQSSLPFHGSYTDVLASAGSGIQDVGIKNRSKFKTIARMSRTNAKS